MEENRRRRQPPEGNVSKVFNDAIKNCLRTHTEIVQLRGRQIKMCIVNRKGAGSLKGRESDGNRLKEKYKRVDTCTRKGTDHYLRRRNANALRVLGFRTRNEGAGRPSTWFNENQDERRIRPCSLKDAGCSRTSRQHYAQIRRLKSTKDLCYIKQAYKDKRRSLLGRTRSHPGRH